MDITAMSGLELLRAAMERGRESGVGIAHLLGMEAESIEEGRVVFSLEAGPQFSNPLGTVHGGILSTLLDSAMSCAVHTALGPGVGYTTLELKVNFIRGAALDAGKLVCEGTTIHVGRRTATAEGRILDTAGRLIAHGTATCMIFQPEK